MANKYRAKSITVNGEYFASTGEYNRHCELELLERDGQIKDLKRQPVIELLPSFKYRGKRYRGITYRADWSYTENDKPVIEDFKGFETAAFKLKKKLFMSKYPDIELRITK